MVYQIESALCIVSINVNYLRFFALELSQSGNCSDFKILKEFLGDFLQLAIHT
jgi:hypothetical protein